MAEYGLKNKSFTAVAVHTAARAGEWVKSKMGQFQDLNLKKSHQDLVTEVDRGSELMIRKLIHTYFPDHAFFGEEGIETDFAKNVHSAEEAEREEYVWIVDPIDGTTNFVHSFPFFCVSLALAHRGEIIAGVVYDPCRDEMFVAEKGQGAYVGGKRMKVSAESRLLDSLVATGFPADSKISLPQNLKGLQAIFPKVRNVRNGGSAALHLAYVAAGRLSGFWEMGLNAWDVAAGVLLVKEAGGSVTDTQGRPYSLTVSNIAASNGAIHDEFINTVGEEKD